MLMNLTSVFATENKKEYELCKQIDKVIVEIPNKVIQNFGKPIKINEKNILNPYTAAIDKEIKFIYLNSTLNFKYISYSSKYYLVSAQVDIKDFNNNLKKIIPKSLSKLFKLYGKATRKEENNHYYCCGFECANYVKIISDGSKTLGFIYFKYLD